jgi:hypothetical protein
LSLLKLLWWLLNFVAKVVFLVAKLVVVAKIVVVGFVTNVVSFVSKIVNIVAKVVYFVVTNAVVVGFVTKVVGFVAKVVDFVAKFFGSCCYGCWVCCQFFFVIKVSVFFNKVVVVSFDVVGFAVVFKVAVVGGSWLCRRCCIFKVVAYLN